MPGVLLWLCACRRGAGCRLVKQASRVLAVPGEQGEPGWHSPSSSCNPEPGQGSVPSSVQSARSNGWARVAGKVKPRTELIFPFRNSFSCPRLVWKLLTPGKKGRAAKQGLCCAFSTSYRLLGWSSFPQACCWGECFQGLKSPFMSNTGPMGH